MKSWECYRELLEAMWGVVLNGGKTFLCVGGGTTNTYLEPLCSYTQAVECFKTHYAKGVVLSACAYSNI